MSLSQIFSVSNPVFDEDFWKPNAPLTSPSVVLPPMTLAGTIDKSLRLIGVMLLGGIVGYFNYSSAIFYISIIVAMIVAVVGVTSKEYAAMAAIIYAALNGFVLGDLIGSSIRFLPTVFTIMGAYLFLVICLNFKLVDATHKGKLWAAAAGGSVLFNYLANIILYIKEYDFCFLHQYKAGTLILLAILLAWMIYHQVFAITKLVAVESQQLPNNMEWVGALGLLAAVAWAFAFVVMFIKLVVEAIFEGYS